MMPLKKLPPDPVALLVNENLKKISAARAPVPTPANVKLIAENAGHKILAVTLAGAVTDFGLETSFDIEGYAVAISKSASDPIAVAMELTGAGIYGPVYPGCNVEPQKRFSRIVMRRWGGTTYPPASTFMDAGTFVLGSRLTLVVAKTPEARWVEPQTDAGGFMFYRLSTAKQAYNSTANVPAALYEGITCRGARSVRVGVQTSDASNITGGTVVWWYNPFHLGDTLDWGETDLQQPLVTGRSFVWMSELECPFKSGRAFPEIRSLTTAGGSGAPTVFVMGFGEGGELNAGDVRA